MDLTQTARFEIGAEDVRRLTQRSIFSCDARRAILVNSDLAFGFARMFVIFRETLGEKGIRVFTDLDEALHWVFLPKSARVPSFSDPLRSLTTHDNFGRP
jgi:hypothetical protein